MSSLEAARALLGILGGLVDIDAKPAKPPKQGQQKLRIRGAAPRPDPRPVEWMTPHDGPPLPTCGQELFWGHRIGSGKIHVHGFAKDCASFECRECRCEFDENGRMAVARGWEHREAGAIHNRIKRARIEHYERGRPIHVILSLPVLPRAIFNTDDLHGFRLARRVASRAAKFVGLRGAALVYHPFRIPSRWNDRTSCSEGPHFHAIGYGWIEEDKVRDLHQEAGWIVKNKGVRDSVYSTALYLLSHAGRPQQPGYPAQERGTDRFLALAVTWFGSLSYNKMPRQETDEPVVGKHCAMCDALIPNEEWFEVEPAIRPDRGKTIELAAHEFTEVVDEFALARRYGPMTRDARASGEFVVRRREVEG